jgi:hypothetical protein
MDRFAPVADATTGVIFGRVMFTIKTASIRRREREDLVE